MLLARSSLAVNISSSSIFIFSSVQKDSLNFLARQCNIVVIYGVLTVFGWDTMRRCRLLVWIERHSIALLRVVVLRVSGELIR